MPRSDYVDEGGPVVCKGLAHRRLEGVRVLDPHSAQPNRACDHGEIGILQGDIGTRIARRLHLHFHEAQSAIVDNDDFHRELELHRGEQFTQKHREPAVSREGDDLAARERGLCPKCLRQGHWPSSHD